MLADSGRLHPMRWIPARKSLPSSLWADEVIRLLSSSPGARKRFPWEHSLLSSLFPHTLSDPGDMGLCLTWQPTLLSPKLVSSRPPCMSARLDQVCLSPQPCGDAMSSSLLIPLLGAPDITALLVLTGYHLSLPPSSTPLPGKHREGRMETGLASAVCAKHRHSNAQPVCAKHTHSNAQPVCFGGRNGF